MIILSGGDDGRMREIVEDALTKAGEPFIITDDESDAISNDQALALMIYNTSKIRTYLGRLERNTRRQDQTLNNVAASMQNIESFLEPVGVFFESVLDEDVPTYTRRTNVQYRLSFVRDLRAKEIRRAREADRGEAEESS